MKVIIPSCRPAMLRDFFTALAACPSCQGYEYYLVLQEYTQADLASVLALGGEWIAQAQVLPERAHPIVLFMQGWAEWAGPDDSAWLMADDDMEFVEGKTNFQPVLDFLCSGVGVVTTRYERTLARTLARCLEHRFVEHPLAPTWGGAVVTGDAIAALLAGWDYAQVMNYDMALALWLYLAGFKNYRYEGSVTLHKCKRKGGMQALDVGWMAESQYVQRERPTALAKETHVEERRKRFGKDQA